MVKNTYSERLKDPRWQKRRLEIMNAAGFKCTWCGTSEDTLNVHHFSYSKSGNPWDVDDSSLVCICQKCHEVNHIKGLHPAIGDCIAFFSTDREKFGEALQALNDYVLHHYNKGK
jgi:5-methylcytosine-specific restriction endonuclease McrA